MNPKALEVLNALHPGGRAFPYQVKWACDESKFKLCVKARQIGITTTQAIDSFLKCLAWRESAKDPNPPVVIFCSPSIRQSNRLIEYIHRCRRRLELLHKVKFQFRKEREDRIVFENGAELWSLPNNPRTIEGIDGSVGIIDELGNFLTGEDSDVYQSLMGSLGAKKGQMVLFGKPRGRRGLFWKIFDPYGDYSKEYSIHVFDWKKRAAVDPEYKKTVESQRAVMTKIQFAENYEAEFCDENILVFPYELLDRQKKDLKLYTVANPIQTPFPVHMGIDFGKVESQTSITMVEEQEHEARVVFHEVTKIRFDEQIKWISALIDAFNPVSVNIDKTGQGIPMLDYLDTSYGGRINGVHFNEATKEKLVLNCRNLFEQGKLWIPESAEDLYEQVHGVERSVSQLGKAKYTGKRSDTDWLDDRAWSLFLAVFSIGGATWNFAVVDRKQPEAVKNDYERWVRDIE